MTVIRTALILALVVAPASLFADTPTPTFTPTATSTPTPAATPRATATPTPTQFPITLRVTKTDDTNDGSCDADCSLREAIEAADALPGADGVAVPAGTYLLTLGALSVGSDMGIKGAGEMDTIIDGNLSSRVLSISGTGAVRISKVTIQRGRDFYFGGGVVNGGTLVLSNSTVRSNTAYPEYYFDPETIGGGILNVGTLVLTNSTVSGNFSNSLGGGIWNSGTLSLMNSTVSRNVSSKDYPRGYGGGIFNSGDMRIWNSTVSGNYAGVPYGYYGGYGIGGGIYNTGTAEIVASTLSANSATRGSGIHSYVAVHLADTIVAANFRGDCDAIIESWGYNLTDDGSCELTEPSDLVVADALLGSLADNGGPTRTHALLPGSPAIDAGSPVCPPPATDQRGVPRPQGTACDIGAFEFGATPPATPTPTVTPIPTPTPTPTPTATPTACTAVWPVTQIVTLAKGQSAANNAKLSHSIVGNIVDPASLRDTAHRIAVCADTAVTARVFDTTGSPRNTASGSLLCDATGCSGIVSANEKYQSISQDGRDRDSITFLAE